VDAPASGKPDKDKQHEYQPNDKWATYSGAKGESQSPHPLCFVRDFPFPAGGSGASDGAQPPGMMSDLKSRRHWH
jgi:hypothetical protein